MTMTKTKRRKRGDGLTPWGWQAHNNLPGRVDAKATATRLPSGKRFHNYGEITIFNGKTMENHHF